MSMLLSQQPQSAYTRSGLLIDKRTVRFNSRDSPHTPTEQFQLQMRLKHFIRKLINVTHKFLIRT